MSGFPIERLPTDQLASVWSIDRSEVIESVYYHEQGRLILTPEHHDVRGWPAGEPEHYEPILLDCLESGGLLFGVRKGGALIAAAVLESRFIGRERNRLQLKFLHVSARFRGRGIARALFAHCVDEARQRGAAEIYVSATSSQRTVDFYLSLGCRVARELDPELFALEPKDIHLEFPIANER